MNRYKKYASEEQLNRHLWLSRCTAQLPSGMKNNYITYGNWKYVAVASGTNKCAYSSDGVNWTEVQLPENSYCKKIVYGNGMYVILSSYKSGTYVNEIMCSNDGVNWLKTSIPCNAEIVDITYGSGIFVAIPRSHYSVYYSKDGSEWNSKDEFCSSKWTSVTYGSGCFVACGIGGCDVLSPPDGDAIIIYKSNIAYSYDGINWNGFYEDKYDLNSATKVVYGNGRFIILGHNSLTGVYSENGRDWAKLTVPAQVNYSSLTFGNGKFVVFTADGSSVLTSSNGVDWDIHELQTQFNVREIAYGKDRFIATLSDSASVIISYDGENWYEDDALRQGSEDVTSAVKAVLGLENAASKDYVDAGLEEAKEYTDSKSIKNYYLDLSDISVTINDFCQSESLDTIFEYALSQDVYDKTLEAIKNKTFSGVIHFDNSGEKCVYPLICYYELADAIMFGIHIGKDNCVSKIGIMISLPEQKCVRIARLIDNNLPFIDLSEIDCTSTIFFELTEEQNHILDYYAISKQPIICAIKLDGSYTSYVTLNYSELVSESYCQFIGSFNGRIIVLTYQLINDNGVWDGVVIDEGYIRIMTKLNSSDELIRLSDEDFLRVGLGCEVALGASMNIEFKEDGVFHCVPLNLITSGSFLAYADTNTRRWYFFEKDDGFYAMSELLELPIKKINITTQPVLNSVVALNENDNILMNSAFIIDYLFTTNCRYYFSVGCINSSEAIMSANDNIRYFTFVDRDRIISIYGDVSNVNNIQWYIEEGQITLTIDRYLNLPSNFVSGENLTIESDYVASKNVYDKIISGEIVGLKFTNTEYSATYNFISHAECKITDDSGMVEYELCAYGYDVNSNKYFEFIITYAEDSTLNIGEININYIE